MANFALSTWSITAGSNNKAPPDGAQENWDGSEVNDWGREIMSVIREWYDDPQWLSITEDLAPRGAKTVSQISPSQFRIVGCDATAYFVAGRRVRMRLGASPPFQEAHVDSSSFTAGDTEVTIIGVNVPATFQDDGADVYFATAIDPGAFVPQPAVADIRLTAGLPSLAASAGWIECDGQQLVAATYLALASAFNAVGGPTTGFYDNHPVLGIPAAGSFRVPDLRGRVPVGFYSGGDGDGDYDYTIDNADMWFGEKTHVLLLAEMAAHDHDAATANAGDHQHTVSYDSVSSIPGDLDFSQMKDSASPATSDITAMNVAGDHVHPLASQGADAAHENTPLGMVMGYVVYSGVIT